MIFKNFILHIPTTVLPPSAPPVSPCLPHNPIPPSTLPKGKEFPWGVKKAWPIKLREAQAPAPTTNWAWAKGMGSDKLAHASGITHYAEGLPSIQY